MCDINNPKNYLQACLRSFKVPQRLTINEFFHDASAIVDYEGGLSGGQKFSRAIFEPFISSVILGCTEKSKGCLDFQLEAAIAAKKACDARVMVLLKEKNSAVERAEEYNDQLQAALKKYKDALQQNSILSIQPKDQFEQVSPLDLCTLLD